MRNSTHSQKMVFKIKTSVFKIKAFAFVFSSSKYTLHPSSTWGSYYPSNLLGGVVHRMGPGGIISVSLAPGPVPGASLALSII